MAAIFTVVRVSLLASYTVVYSANRLATDSCEPGFSR